MLLRQDELNDLKGNLTQYKGNLKKTKEIMLDWLLLAYSDGTVDVSSQLNGEWQAPVDRVEEVINADIAGKTVMDRVEQYFYLEDIEAITDLAGSERNRVYHEAAHDTALGLNAKTKTWHCMMLPTSRDTHIYLNGTTKGINEEFYTYNGDSAQHPGGFGVADEDINCICYLTYSK